MFMSTAQLSPSASGRVDKNLLASWLGDIKNLSKSCAETA
jgi:hypothetical protein